MEDKDFKEFEIKRISQSAKRLFHLGLSIDEILEEITAGVSEMTSELTAEELYRNERNRKRRGLKN